MRLSVDGLKMITPFGDAAITLRAPAALPPIWFPWPSSIEMAALLLACLAVPSGSTPK
jgi:hypothetical protein